MVLAGAALLAGGGGAAQARAHVILHAENLQNCHTLEYHSISNAGLRFKLVYGAVSVFG